MKINPPPTLDDDVAAPQGEAQHEMDRLVGQRLRLLRSRKRLSLTSLSAVTGLSIGFLSQIERGLSSPSLRDLSSLAVALETSLSDLFPTSEAKAATPVMRHDKRPHISLWRGGISKTIITPQSHGNLDLVMFQVVMEPGGSSGDDDLRHEGEECGCVVEGVLELTVDGVRYLLDEGDGFKFASTVPHRFRNPGTVTTKVYWVNVREVTI